MGFDQFACGRVLNIVDVIREYLAVNPDTSIDNPQLIAVITLWRKSTLAMHAGLLRKHAAGI
jgi:hypothetical protein